MWTNRSSTGQSNKPCPCCYDLDAIAAADGIDARNVRGTLDQTQMVIRLLRSLQTIENAATSGCKVCKLLVNILLHFDPNSRSTTTQIVLQLPIGHGNLQILFPLDGPQNVVQVYTSPANAKLWHHISPLPEICTDRLSKESLSFIRSCLKSCLENHPLCQQRQSNSSKGPARLIYVGDSSQTTLRLVETNQLAGDPAYNALSYCWGDDISIKTTVSNMHTLTSGIALGSLPQTLVDAVLLTQELGIKFLWIDALCIIQDSHEDWEKESANMASIYANAHLTIAAASAASATQGFLQHSATTGNHQEQKDFSEIIHDDDGTQILLKARLIPQYGIHWKWTDNFEDRFPKEPWSRRGWTLQEQLLSTRLLCISSTEMQWTCWEAEVCECNSKQNKRRQFGGTPIALIDDASVIFRLWKKIVEIYSVRSLTYSSDKLPAVSGIAEVVQQKTGSRYIAGLWADNIDLDLLWRRTGPSDDRDNENNRAASFSWASIDGEIDYYCFRNGKQAYRSSTVLTLDAVPTTEQAPLGSVIDGTLSIRGPLVSATIEQISPNCWMQVKIDDTLLVLATDTVVQGLVFPRPDGELQTTACRWPRHNGSLSSRRSGRQAGPSELRDSISYEPNGRLTGTLPARGTQCWVLQLGAFAQESHQSIVWDHELLILGRSSRSPKYYERLGLTSFRGNRLDKTFGDENVHTITLV
ncbi:HET domain-containing protein [Pochonia chlamydosporia 170]|uniref:HET domain-containing protein n=1 Tax=Pochonia chlamydosporia 170 TaxID=1380566 RepID=A0A179FCL7_METCM|nr:HET domain-containing protein [Pochonia chlamydosporia 170]OAQ62849.1 HET domain-containing protein [Pochonia chlamydosporia 170]